MTYWSDFTICTSIVVYKFPAIFGPITIVIFIFNINIGSLCDQQSSLFGPFESFVTIDLLLLQLIRIDLLFLSIYYRFSDLFSLSDCRIGITLAHLVYFTICTAEPLLSFVVCLLG